MLANDKKSPFLGQILLLTATVIWGTSFIIFKDTLDTMPVLFVLAIRFLLSSLCIFIIFFKKIIKMNKKTVVAGLILGAVLASAYIFQTYGLTGVTPGENAFLTSTYTVLVPFMCWLFFRRKPDVFSFIAGITCLVGIAFVAFYDGINLGIGLGQILTLVGAVFYALQIIVIDVKGEGADPIAMLFLELLVVGVASLIGTCCVEVGRVNISLNLPIILKLLYLSLFCTLIAQGLQIVGQKLVTASQASIILSFEAVFGLIFSIIFGADKLTPISSIGFALIFISVIISETKLKFLFKKSKNKNDDLSNIKGENYD
jgi:drug/metabolite transporter (DMT)-like permease